MRFAFAVFAVLALISVSSFAAENPSKPSLTKGTKSYQSRSVDADQNVAAQIEPAAGEGQDFDVQPDAPKISEEVTSPNGAPALSEKLHLPRKN